MTELRIEPIRTWPGDFTVDRRSATFRSTSAATMKLLEAELDYVDAVAVVLQLAISRDDLRLNGALRSTMRTEHPGVILTFTSPKLGKVRFVTDRFVSWEDNLRGVALGLEALRKIDRYGITSDGEQYAGFRALEASAGAAGFSSSEDAARYIADLALGDDVEEAKVDRIAGAMLDDAELVDVYYRRAAKASHPDAGGSEVAMARLNAARAMLDEAGQ